MSAVGCDIECNDIKFESIKGVLSHRLTDLRRVIRRYGPAQVVYTFLPLLCLAHTQGSIADSGEPKTDTYQAIFCLPTHMAILCADGGGELLLSSSAQRISK